MNREADLEVTLGLTCSQGISKKYAWEKRLRQGAVIADTK